jgi:hypothetical protein
MKTLTNYANLSESRKCFKAQFLLVLRTQKAAGAVMTEFLKAAFSKKLLGLILFQTCSGF